MANEKRLIDANALNRTLHPIAMDLANKYGNLGGAVSGVIMHINNAPTVEAVEIVRCQDCKHRYSDSWCEYVDDDDNFYCAKGERKDGDGNG